MALLVFIFPSASYLVCGYIVNYLTWGREGRKQMRSFCSLIYSTKDSNGLVLGQAKPEARNLIPVSHVDGKYSTTWAITCCLSVCVLVADWNWEWSWYSNPGLPVWHEDTLRSTLLTLPKSTPVHNYNFMVPLSDQSTCPSNMASEEGWILLTQPVIRLCPEAWVWIVLNLVCITWNCPNGHVIIWSSFVCNQCSWSCS